jgi:thiamine kinase-like enzyme
MASAIELEAMDVARRNVLSALSRWNPQSGDRFTIGRINGGFTNFNWMATATDGTSYFVKSPGAHTSLFIDRRVARDASFKAGEIGCAPRLHYTDPENGAEIYEFLDGYRSATITDMFDDAVVARVVEGYKSVHSTQTFLATSTGFNQIDDHLRQIVECGAPMPPTAPLLASAIEDARLAVTASGLDLCGCYNDGHITNYMINDSGDVKIIDWEYAANNDRYWDIALFSFETFMWDERLKHLIEEYDGRWSAQADARLYVYRALVCVKWSLWAALQAHLSSLHFDFRKYSEFLLMRAKHAIGQDTWAQALRTL